MTISLGDLGLQLIYIFEKITLEIPTGPEYTYPFR